VTIHDILLRRAYGLDFEDWKYVLRQHDITCDVINLLDRVPQHLDYHPEYDALLHTYYVCKSIPFEHSELIEAAFLHDIGKAFCTTIGGRKIYSYNHDIKSLEWISQENVKQKIKFFDLTYEIIKHHMGESKTDLQKQFFEFDHIKSKSLFLKEYNLLHRYLIKLRFYTMLFKRKFLKKHVYVTIGISGSGKSTYLKNVDKKYIVSSDSIRKELCGNISDQSKNRQVWTTIPIRMREILRKYGKVYLDATNVKKSERIILLSQFNDCKKIAIVFHVSEDIAYDRVRSDIVNNIDRSDVPVEVITRQKKNFNSGYDSIFNEFDKVIEVKKR